MSDTKENAAIGLDAVKAAARSVAGTGGVPGTVGTIVAVASSVASGLLRSGLSPEEVVEKLKAIRPARDEQIDAEIEELIGRMPGQPQEQG